MRAYNPLRVLRMAKPATPASGEELQYPKTDGRWYGLGPDGSEYRFLDTRETATGTYFHGYVPGGTAIATGANVNYTVKEDTAGRWSTSNRNFTVAVPGLYRITLSSKTSATAATVTPLIQKNGASIVNGYDSPNAAYSGVAMSTVERFAAGDVIAIRYNNAFTVQNDGGVENTFLIIEALGVQFGLADVSAQATLGAGQGDVNQQTIPSGAFTKVSLPTEVFDPGNNFTPASSNTDTAATTSVYTVPAAGLYLVVAKVRLVDGSPTGVSFGMGVHTSTADNADFQWQSTASAPANSRRQTFNYQRLSRFAAGDVLRLFCYSDGTAINLASASLSITRQS